MRAKYSRKRKDLDELVENCGLEILDFLPNVGVICSVCNGKMKNNGGANYICGKCGRQTGTPNKREIRRIRDCAFKREKALKTILNILNKYDIKDTGNLNLDIGELGKYL
jgi:predicted amidophosphoribosyltransferase